MGGPTGISLALAALSLSPTTTNPSTSPTANPQATLHQRRVSSPSGAMPTRMDRWVNDTVSRVNARPIPYLIGVMVFGLLASIRVHVGLLSLGETSCCRHRLVGQSLSALVRH